MRLGSLFTGYGGLEMAAGPHFDAETVWCSDIDPGACRIIAHRFPGIPNLGDITRVDWTQVEPVDVLTGGFPCQDLSHAGKRLGLKPGTRSGLWTRMAYVISQLRPRYVVAENVRGLLSARADSDLEPCPWCVGGAADGEPDLRALGAVLGDLAGLGYDTRWVGLRAADAGAPHGRFRIFILAADTTGDGRDEGRPEPARLIGGPDAAERGATPADTERLGRAGRGGVRDVGEAPEDRSREAQQRQWDRDAADDSGATPTDTESDSRWVGDGDGCAIADTLCLGDGRREEPRAPTVQRLADGTQRRCTAPADAQGPAWRRAQPEHLGTLIGSAAEPGERAGTNWGDYEPAIRRWESILGRPAPAPTEPGPKSGRRLSPRFDEFMMGLPEGWVTDVPGLSRNAQLKALGNGVVPQQAAAALRMLTGMEAAA